MSRPRLARTALAALVTLGLLWLAGRPSPADDAPRAQGDAEPHRSPVALALSSEGSKLLTANQTAGTVSLIDTATGKVLAEVPTGEKPAGVAFAPGGDRAVVSHWYGYDLAILDVGPDSLEVAGRVEVGPEPRGVAIDPDGKTAYVAVGVSNEVVRVDLESRTVTGRIEVGREPRGLALTPDGATLVASNARAGSISVIDAKAWSLTRTIPTLASNLRQVAIGPEAEWAYVAGMENRGFATTQQNIDKGWVLGQRLLRVPLDGAESYETLSLDPQGEAAADAHGVAAGGDGTFVAVGLGGTHEVMIFRNDGRRLPWRRNGARDLIAPELLRNDGRFRRVALGGRPTELAFAPDGRTLYVANYLGDSVQVVDAHDATLVRTIELGGPSEVSLARRGEAIFHDATRSFNQWYSCNTCHSDGHTNGLDFDTMNDGWQDFSTSHARSRKKVPTLRRVAATGPWTWHGWQDRLEDAMNESFTKSMQGKPATPEDVEAIVAYLKTLEFPRNPNAADAASDGPLAEAARRGAAVYRSSKAACASCHGGPELTDGEVHVVGLEERGDVYKGYNPPSLRGLYDKDPYLHDGRASNLREVLTEWHNPEDVTGLGSLSDEELDDLIVYLKTL